MEINEREILKASAVARKLDGGWRVVTDRVGGTACLQRDGFSLYMMGNIFTFILDKKSPEISKGTNARNVLRKQVKVLRKYILYLEGVVESMSDFDY